MLCPLADVIANLCNHRRFRVDVIPLFDYGRCYCHVADGIATGGYNINPKPPMVT